MKYLIFLIFLSFSMFIANAQNLVEKANFSYLNEKVNITYQFIAAEQNETFYVWVEGKTAKERILTLTSLAGDVGEISGTGAKQVVWDIKSDGVILDEPVYFTVYAVKMPKNKLGKALLLNTVLPGAGMTNVGARRNAAWVGVLGYGAVGAAVAFNLMAAQNFDKYITEENPNLADNYYANANKLVTYSLAGVGTAAGIWAATWVTSIAKNKKSKIVNPESLKNNAEQTVFSAKTETKILSTRGLPPNLFTELKFSDANGNGILEADETGVLTVKISNQGKGDATGLEIFIQDSVVNKNLIVSGKQSINRIKPGESVLSNFGIKAGSDIETGKHKLEIVVKEAYGFDMNPAFLRLPTYAYQAPKFAVSGYEIVDYGEGTGAITEDGQLQLGEQVKVKLTLQNIGQGEAKNIAYNLSTIDNNVFLDQTEGKIDKLDAGDLQTVTFILAPNKRVQAPEGELKLTLHITESSGKGTYLQELYIALNQKAPKPVVVNVNADINSLKKDIAVFVTDSKKFTSSIGNLADVKTVVVSTTRRPNALGVIIGISRYENMAPAPYADNDALLMKDYFTKVLGIENVITLTNQDITGARLKRIFADATYGELKKNVLPDSTEIFVFYSGHGVPNKTGEKVYLFPYDGVADGLEEFAYNIETLYANLNAMNAKSVTLFIDACFSGFSKASGKIAQENLIAQKGVKVKPIKPWLNNPKFSVFSSSTAEETSLGFDPTETGLFTYYLASGMQGKADTNVDRKITAGELFEYIQKNVKETSVKISGLQSPEFFGNEERVLIEY